MASFCEETTLLKARCSLFMPWKGVVCDNDSGFGISPFGWISDEPYGAQNVSCKDSLCFCVISSQ